MFRRPRWRRWHRRRLVPRRRRSLMRRLIIGATIFFLVRGAARAIYKLRRRDVVKIEREAGKSTTEMTEDELKATMRKLGIRELEVSPEDETIIAQYCPWCGTAVDKDARFCASCGAPLFED